jgi:hypothetical protein
MDGNVPWYHVLLTQHDWEVERGKHTRQAWKVVLQIHCLETAPHFPRVQVPMRVGPVKGRQHPVELLGDEIQGGPCVIRDVDDASAFSITVAAGKVLSIYSAVPKAVGGEPARHTDKGYGFHCTTDILTRAMGDTAPSPLTGLWK